MNKQRGFTLLEIIVALVIFALSAMMVVTTIMAQRRRYIWSAAKIPR